MGRRKKVSAELRKHAGAMLAAVRRVPFWDDEPSAKQQDWWHRLQRGVCDYAGCNGTPCYCDPDCDQEMQRRLHETRPAMRRLAELSNLYREDLPEVAELVGDPWMPNSKRARLIKILSAMAATAPGPHRDQFPPQTTGVPGDMTSEHLFPLAELPDHWPALPGGRRLHRSVGYRYARRGIGPGRIRLETVQMGSTLYTSSEAVARFAARLRDVVSDEPRGRSMVGRQRSSRRRRASRILDDAGV